VAGEDSDLLEAVREAGFNLSATLERALAEELASLKRLVAGRPLDFRYGALIKGASRTSRR
jgi:hypothetical protein